MPAPMHPCPAHPQHHHDHTTWARAGSCPLPLLLLLIAIAAASLLSCCHLSACCLKLVNYLLLQCLHLPRPFRLLPPADAAAAAAGIFTYSCVFRSAGRPCSTARPSTGSGHTLNAGHQNFPEGAPAGPCCQSSQPSPAEQHAACREAVIHADADALQALATSSVLQQGVHVEHCRCCCCCCMLPCCRCCSLCCCWCLCTGSRCQAQLLEAADAAEQACGPGPRGYATAQRARLQPAVPCQQAQRTLSCAACCCRDVPLLCFWQQ
jgi:hypothetical protein